MFAPPTPMSEIEVRSLSLEQLVARMDEVRLVAECQRYGTDWVIGRSEHFPFPRVADILRTETATKKGEAEQRKLADAAFRFLFQMDLISVSAGIANKVVYGPQYHEGIWHQPANRLASVVLDQYSIIASRVALECFFDLIYIADQGRRMKGRSKFSTFRKWVTQSGNPYKYFVGHILQGFDFDRHIRQPEVHGTSRFANELLRLELPDSNERNISVGLYNVLLSVWAPLILILDGKKPRSITIFDGVGEFADKYFESLDDATSFDQFVEDLLSARLS